VLSGIANYNDITGENKINGGSAGGSLMKYVTMEVLERVGVTEGGKIVPAVGGLDDDADDEEMTDDKDDDQIIDGKPFEYKYQIPLPISAYRLSTSSKSKTKLPRSTLKFLQRVLPTERSSLSMDSLALFRKVIELDYDGRTDLLLGELALTFLGFISLECWGSFERWKSLVVLISKSIGEETYRGSDSEGQFFVDFASLFVNQLGYVEEDFFGYFNEGMEDQEGDGSQEEDGEGGGNFLLSCFEWIVTGLTERSTCEGTTGRSGEAARVLRELVKRKFGVDVSGGDDADMSDDDEGGDNFHLHNLMSSGINNNATDDDGPVLVSLPFERLDDNHGVGGRRSRSNSFAENANSNVIYSPTSGGGGGGGGGDVGVCEGRGY